MAWVWDFCFLSFETSRFGCGGSVGCFLLELAVA